MKTRDLRQTVTFEHATPHQIYELLMDSRKHAAFTGGEAQISREIGEQSRAYDDWVEAYNVELIPDQKIVQKWRGSDWPAEHFSIATFEFAPAGESGENTELSFTQTEVPVEFAKDIAKGWETEYWQKMKAYLLAENS